MIEWAAVFDAIGALSQAAMAAAVVAGVLVARGQLRHARAEKLNERRTAIALETVDVVSDISSKMGVVRLPPEFGPGDFSKDPANLVQSRLRELQESQGDMEKLERLSEFLSGLGISAPSDIYDFRMLRDDLFFAFVQLLRVANSEAKIGSDLSQADYDAAFLTAFSVGADDVFAHNKHVLTRKIINEMTNFVRREGGL